jgi:hypothetical protein
MAQKQVTPKPGATSSAKTAHAVEKRSLKRMARKRTAKRLSRRQLGK